ncbi:GNAT family N-acetyltransferase [Undibacterium umbellatum]|uniref:GNAT family N-acetyltransferase n=1 Tax=Undibacterium umbellatum TaxID=2762300 RepID=A0ABR6Z4K5_9BURK|nr:GNAT family N-acetyltransferase [Undibacterium umbellatum]MBC3906578.1 GNAT family N-acetyltransferase [Undibacterium umbellatum]
MNIIKTERLLLRTVTADDAAFYLSLVNDPAFIENIRDKGIRTLDEALNDIINGPMANQEKTGFSLYVVEHKEDGQAMGLCGLVKRESLKNIDLGYAFLPQFLGQGYAREAAGATLAYANTHLGMTKLAAITAPGNLASNKLLQDLGFKMEAVVILPGESKDTNLYAYEF